MDASLRGLTTIAVVKRNLFTKLDHFGLNWTEPSWTGLGSIPVNVDLRKLEQV